MDSGKRPSSPKTKKTLISRCQMLVLSLLQINCCLLTAKVNDIGFDISQVNCERLNFNCKKINYYINYISLALRFSDLKWMVKTGYKTYPQWWETAERDVLGLRMKLFYTGLLCIRVSHNKNRRIKQSNQVNTNYLRRSTLTSQCCHHRWSCCFSLHLCSLSTTSEVHVNLLYITDINKSSDKTSIKTGKPTSKDDKNLNNPYANQGFNREESKSHKIEYLQIGTHFNGHNVSSKLSCCPANTDSNTKQLRNKILIHWLFKIEVLLPISSHEVAYFNFCDNSLM